MAPSPSKTTGRRAAAHRRTTSERPSQADSQAPADFQAPADLQPPREEDAQNALAELARRVGELCRAAGATIALGESCTGGLVSHLITEVPGASAYLRGGVVAYGDEAKATLLDVAPAALREHGAVSAQVAIAMASGARRRFRAEMGAAVTGIAGPSGGSAQKPVGLTYVAVADAAGSEVRRFLWLGDRHANKLASAQATLELLIDRLSAAS